MTRCTNIAVMFVLSLSIAMPTSAQTPSPIEGAKVHDFTGDIRGRPAPPIPKSWRFVDVTNGEKRNVNNLWFEDADGALWLIQVFVTEFNVGGAVVLSDIYRLQRR